MRDGLGLGRVLMRDSNQTFIKLRPPGLWGEKVAGAFPIGSHSIGADFQRLMGQAHSPSSDFDLDPYR